MGKCPKCGSQFSAEAGATHVTCPGCGRRYRIRSAKAAKPRGMEGRPPTQSPDEASPPPPSPPPLDQVVPNSSQPQQTATPATGSLWYIAIGAEQVGPLDDGHLEDLAGSGVVDEQTLVWREGMDDWDKAGNVSEMGELLAQVCEQPSASGQSSPPPPPPPPPTGTVAHLRGASQYAGIQTMVCLFQVVGIGCWVGTALCLMALAVIVLALVSGERSVTLAHALMLLGAAGASFVQGMLLYGAGQLLSCLRDIAINTSSTAAALATNPRRTVP